MKPRLLCGQTRLAGQPERSAGRAV